MTEPYTEADVEAMAKVVAEAFGDPTHLWPDFIPESRAILRLLAGRLLPEGVAAFPLSCDCPIR